MRARRDLAQQRDAAQDRVDLLDLLVEPLDERFEEVELLLHEPHGHVFVTLPDAVDDRVRRDRHRPRTPPRSAATRSLSRPRAPRRRRSDCSSRRSATMSIAFATRSASPTEVPPNLMTITTAECKPFRAFHRSSSAFRQRCAGGAADGVVHERDHADVEERAGAEAADGDGHAVLAVAVEARLRTIGLGRRSGSAVSAPRGDSRRCGSPVKIADRVADRRRDRRAPSRSFSEIVIRWPSMVGTRFICAEMRNGASMKRSLVPACRGSCAARSRSSPLRRRRCTG